MFSKYFFNLNVYLTLLLGLVAVLGDYVVSVSKIHLFQAVFDNATHALIGGLSWFIVCINYKRELGSFRILLETACCTFLASLIDLDHFAAAKSLNLKDATNLKERPPLHCSTFPLLLSVSLLVISYVFHWEMVKRYALIVLTAFASHHTRDATRRGYWLYPYKSTPPLPYSVYVLLSCAIPHFICFLYKHVDARATTDLYFSTIWIFASSFTLNLLNVLYLAKYTRRIDEIEVLLARPILLHHTWKPNMTRVSELSPSSAGEPSSREYIKKHAKLMLKNSVFIGMFQEKRFVEQLNSYRDVITVAHQEDKFITNLLAVKKRIEEGFLKTPWVGITEPDTVGAPVGYNLWVELEEEVFGRYWYRVRTVDFLQNEIRLKLDVIRPVEEQATSCSSVEESIGMFDFRDRFHKICEALRINLSSFCKTTVTFQNMKQSVIFLCLLVGAVVTGGFNIVHYLLEYMLKLIRELSFFIKAATPIIVSCLNLVGRSIFGFYSMIVALFKKTPPPQPVYNAYISYDQKTNQYQQYSPSYNQLYYSPNRQLEYYPNTSGIRARITALN
ncbi:hypothetical protein NQ315_012689 [Exocentrus adspersus]|uniref:Transmembrane protein 267 n=1 Tax=Exocentrus adspersus TaxID=1586481 RepID=A0AAV8VT95_9CUCU|nr:hypothetical protein NQ315_012689 [Exocentrus adspersus]